MHFYAKMFLQEAVHDGCVSKIYFIWSFLCRTLPKTLLDPFRFLILLKRTAVVFPCDDQRYFLKTYCDGTVVTQHLYDYFASAEHKLWSNKAHSRIALLGSNISEITSMEIEIYLSREISHDMFALRFSKLSR